MAGEKSTQQASGPLKRVYDRCMAWISGPYGVWVLFVIAFVESSFFPIPPDVFLIAMCVAAPTRAFKYAAICAAGSVAGGTFGYGLGFWFMDSLGLPNYQLVRAGRQVRTSTGSIIEPMIYGPLGQLVSRRCPISSLPSRQGLSN